jgi:diguanylate cyclase (GGDEF)-like protein/PAS domain S-box-containing protein
MAIKKTVRKNVPVKKNSVYNSLYLEKECNRAILASVGEAVIITDSKGKIIRFNPEAQKLTGFSRHQAENSFFQEVITVIDSVTGKPVENPFRQLLRRREILRFDKHVAMINPRGVHFSIESAASPMFDGNRRFIGMVFVFRDISECRDLTLEMSYREIHDELTGLYNRVKFKERLEALVRDAAEHNRQHALLYLDLDKFKVINDTCGHEAGDQLLKQISEVIQGKVRQSDLVARLGGDEFGVLLVHCPLKKADEIAAGICKAVNKFHFAWKDNPFTVGVSIGVVGIKSSNNNADNLLSAADGSCYIAKEKGGSRAHLHIEDDLELSRRHGEMQYISRIARAFEHDLFRLFYQPIVPIGKDNTSKAVWYEILIRMMEENGTVVAPMNFLPAAERYDLMPSIDRWVFSTFFAFYKNRISGHAQPGGFICDINVSGMTLNDDSFLDFVKGLFIDYNVPPQNICIEITETSAIANLNQAIHFINELKTLGCKFSLDDFGSGLSSFKYLKHLPIDYLKIDGSFVKNIMNNSFDSAIVATINEIGHLMGIKTVAEFVETKEIFEKLHMLKVDFAQGYWIAMPRPLEESLQKNMKKNNKNLEQFCV